MLDNTNMGRGVGSGDGRRKYLRILQVRNQKYALEYN